MPDGDRRPPEAQRQALERGGYRWGVSAACLVQERDGTVGSVLGDGRVSRYAYATDSKDAGPREAPREKREWSKRRGWAACPGCVRLSAVGTEVRKAACAAVAGRGIPGVKGRKARTPRRSPSNDDFLWLLSDPKGEVRVQSS